MFEAQTVWDVPSIQLAAAGSWRGQAYLQPAVLIFRAYILPMSPMPMMPTTMLTMVVGPGARNLRASKKLEDLQRASSNVPTRRWVTAPVSPVGVEAATEVGVGAGRRWVR